MIDMFFAFMSDEEYAAREQKLRDTGSPELFIEHDRQEREAALWLVRTATAMVAVLEKIAAKL